VNREYLAILQQRFSEYSLVIESTRIKVGTRQKQSVTCRAAKSASAISTGYLRKLRLNVLNMRLRVRAMYACMAAMPNTTICTKLTELKTWAEKIQNIARATDVHICSHQQYSGSKSSSERIAVEVFADWVARQSAGILCGDNFPN